MKMKKVISTVLALLIGLTFVTAVIAKEGKKAEKVAKVKGTIVSVEEKEGVTYLTLQPKKGDAMIFHLAEGFEIKMGRKKIAIMDVKPQMKARISYYKDDKTLVATAMKVSKPKAAKKSK